MHRFAPHAFCLASAAGLLGLAPASQAVLITVTSGPNAGTVVFNSNGFEADTVGNKPASANATGAYDYIADNGISVETGDITSSISQGPTVAFEGDNYLVLDRQNQTSSSRIGMDLTDPINPATTSFRIEYALWGSGLVSAFGVGEDGAETTSGNTDGVLNGWGEHHSGDIPNADRFVRFGDSTAGGTVDLDTVPTTNFKVGEWNTIVYEWDHDSLGNASLGGGPGEGFLTINGTTVSIGRHHIAGDTDGNTLADQVDHFFGMANAGGAAVFIDSVPEPGSAALCVTGLALMLVRRR